MSENCPVRFCVCTLTRTFAHREAVGQKCDVTNWDSHLALFELGISTFGAIDVVVCPAPTEVDDRHDPRFPNRLRTLVSVKLVPSTGLNW